MSRKEDLSSLVSENGQNIKQGEDVTRKIENLEHANETNSSISDISKLIPVVSAEINKELKSLSEQERMRVFKQLVHELKFIDVCGLEDPGLGFLLAMLQVPIIQRGVSLYYGRPSFLLHEGSAIAAQRKLLLESVTLKPPGGQDHLDWFGYQAKNHTLVEAWKKMLKPAEKSIMEGDLSGLLNGYFTVFGEQSDFCIDWVTQNHKACDYLVYRDRAKRLNSHLKSFISGQDKALESLCDGYAQARLNVNKGPRAIFTLMGEPGTGKTLLAETFAEQLENVEGEPFNFLRFDMQQYTDEKAVASLLGVGQFYADPSMGELTTQVYCYPKTVILFDEIEKAHPQIIQSLLAILDRGLCQDSTSFKWVDFSQTFILFTTNLGSEELSQRRESGQVFGTLDTTSLGGLLRQDKNNSDKGLSPEFVNRLSKGHLLVFESLCPEHLLDIYKSSWKRCSSEISTLAVDTPDCSTELATINLLKRLPDLSARTANSAAESDIVDCLEPILECYENSSLPGEEFYISVKVSGLEDVLNSLMADRGLDNPETVLIVDDDDRTEAQIIQGCAKAGLPIRHKRIAHEMSSQIVSKELRPDLILIDLFIEDDVAQLKSTTALSLIMELRNRFLDVPIVAFCRDPGRAKVTEKAIKAAKSIDGITAVLTYQSKRPEDFINEVTLMLKKRRLARLVQAVVRERKRLQFDWRAKAKTDHITLETILTRLEPIITPGDEGQMSGLGEIPDLKFSDIVGNERGVRQISRAIGWLQHPGRIGRFGFRPPGGYLLAGPPGTGKTFLARAAAGECGLPFFSINSAELLSPGAGVAESKLRDLFANARRLAPSIIFIDEIDAIGQQRRSGDYHGIVNTLLGEMDGFSGHSRPVLVLAATNFPNSLDSALTRPGRFDETIDCDLPNRKAREQLIQKGIERLEVFLPDEAEEKLVLRTQGESAASIESAIRHAVYIADGEDRDPTSEDILEAFEQRVYGTPREDLTLAKEEKWSTACHEAGHALAMHYLLPGVSIDYISIQPRTGSLGFVAWRDESNNASGQLGMTRTDISRQIAVCLAGREAERLMLGEAGMSNGAGSDLMKANNLARKAVMQLGLDSEIGALQVHPEQLNSDPSLAKCCNDRIKFWLNQSEQEVRQLLEENKARLKALSEKLYEAESMEIEEFIAIMSANSKLENDTCAKS